MRKDGTGRVIGNSIKGFILDWMVREGNTEDMTFELRSEG